MSSAKENPSSPYRNEVDALRERKDNLEKEIARLEAQNSELESLKAQKETVERDLSSMLNDAPANNKRSLPMLDNVKVASPCSANWDEMLGDAWVRFCLSCEKNVYNLSAMTRDEAESLLQERAKKELCVRFYQRADGTLLTTDCPVGVKKKRRKKIALAIAGAGAMAFAATAALTRGGRCVQGEPVMQGAIAMPMPSETAARPVTSTTTPPDDFVEMKGEVAAPPPTTTTPRTPPRHR